jgi:hypothetical protein
MRRTTVMEKYRAVSDTATQARPNTAAKTSDVGK